MAVLLLPYSMPAFANSPANNLGDTDMHAKPQTRTIRPSMRSVRPANGIGPVTTPGARKAAEQREERRCREERRK